MGLLLYRKPPVLSKQVMNKETRDSKFVNVAFHGNKHFMDLELSER